MRTKATLFLVGLTAVLALAAACGGDDGDPVAGTTWKMIQLGPKGFPGSADRRSRVIGQCQGAGR